MSKRTTRKQPHSKSKSKSKTLKKSNRPHSRFNTTTKRSFLFNRDDYNHGNGMLTYIWGPPLWHTLHTISFNYPTHPTKEDKKRYREWVYGLKYILPCHYCRENLKKNMKKLPLTMERMKSRESFSRYMYELHEHVNEMLGKVSGLTYEDVRERYEHFRARCSSSPSHKKSTHYTRKNSSSSSSSSKKEKGCTNPLYGKKSKCVMSIVPLDTKCDTFTVD